MMKSLLVIFALLFAAPAHAVIYATDYGVVCDGVTYTTAALRDAVSAMIATKQKLKLPAGTCMTAVIQIVNFDGVAIEGEGEHVTTIKKWNIDDLGPVLEIKNGQRLTLGNLTIHGNRGNHSSDLRNNYGIWMDNVKRARFYNLTVEETESSGLFASGSLGESNDIDFDTVTFRNVRTVHIAGHLMQRWSVRNSRFYSFHGGAECIRASTTDSTWIGNWIWCGMPIAMTVKDPRNVLVGNHIIGNQTAGHVGLEWGEHSDGSIANSNRIEGATGILFALPGNGYTYFGMTMNSNQIESSGVHIHTGNAPIDDATVIRTDNARTAP